MKTKLNKGHKDQFHSIISNIKSGKGIGLIPYDELINVAKAGFAAVESLKTGNRIKID